MRRPRLYRGRHRPTKTEPAIRPLVETPAGPLVQTWEQCRTWNARPPSIWRDLLKRLHS